ncbi:MAG: ABC transporter permease subunit [Acidobacteriota bacterium]|nr:ABC transporter permease subunit [Acidobacteriota bacterium]
MGAWIMAGVTFREALRKKVAWMALIVGAAFLALFGTSLHFQFKDISVRVHNPVIRRQVLDATLIMGLYAADLLAVLMAILTAADSLSGEIASGTIHAIATKPVTRRQIMIGKWLGFAAMLTLYIILMLGGVAFLSFLLGGATPRFLLRGLGLVWLEAILVLNLTLLCGTAFSTLTNGVIVLGLHGLAFLGGWIEQIGALTHSPHAVDAGIVASIIMPSESLWRRAAFEMQSPLAGAINFSPFSTASVPSMTMVAYAAVYLLIALMLALHQFRVKDL